MHHPSFHPLFIDYITYFNGNRDYFECHEVLEEYWKDIAPRDKEHVLVGLVQIATGMYHWRRGNLRGAIRIFEKGIACINAQQAHPLLTVFHMPQLLERLQNTKEQMIQQQPFTPFLLPVHHVELHAHIMQCIASLPPADEDFLRDKHKLRDRTEVYEARDAKIAARRA